MNKKWIIKKYDENILTKIQKENNVSSTLAKLIISRNVENIEEYLRPSLTSLRDPYIMKDMSKIVDRITKAIESKEKITIFGDYDVDGVTSINILMSFILERGGIVDYYLPDRLEEGYGLNKEALKQIRERGTTLVVTVDCGISAIEEVDYANSIGLDVCITDHHECPDILPNACAIVNPKQKDCKYEFKMFAGVGVAFKVISALAMKYNLEKDTYLKFLDIAALGTISDIVPLVDENRTIAKYGIEKIKETENLGLKALIKVAGYKQVDSTMVSFGLAPRINACGRMGDSSLAVKLFFSKTIEEAQVIAQKLEVQNRQRQDIEKKIYNEALEIIKKEELYKNSTIVLGHKDWHHGVIGIVASKLTELYVKPVILLTFDKGIGKGSGRTPFGFSLYEALSECSKYIIQFGGHEVAAGLTIKEADFDNFKNMFEKVANKNIKGQFEQTIEIDTEVTKADLNKATIKDIDAVKPFGQANTEPIFIYRKLAVSSVRTLMEDKHLKLVLKDENNLIDAIAFGMGNRRDELVLGQKIDVVCSIGINNFGPTKKVQLIIKDFSKSY
ncbi:MAG: single-stranded-DNA-specific exonuclease RecJ [Clostridia bacterium]